MKIALLIYGSLDTLSGGYLYDRKLVEYLRSQGDEVEIISLPWRDYLRHLGDNLSADLYRRLASLEADVLLQDELNHPSLFWTNRRLRGRVKYPVVSIVHHLRSSERHPAWAQQVYRRVERAYLRRVDGFVFNSRTTQESVRGLTGQARPGVIAYPAADHRLLHITDPEIAQREKQPGPLRLLFVGNLIPRKGLHTLLEALARLPGGDYHLDVVGSPDFDPAYTAAIHRQIKALHLEADVRMRGALQDRLLEEAYQRAQVMVLPSSYEGFGIVYLEAIGAGLPCIASTSGAAGEIITNGETGFLISPEDAAALSERLRELAGDPDLRLRMSRAARRRYLTHPTWEQTGEQIRHFLWNSLSNAT
jgi:glycosyltransferase involved in cell wall biosynthesis